MKFLNSIASSLFWSSLVTAGIAKAQVEYDSTCSITRLSTGETTYRKCFTEGARMLDGRHQVTRIYLDNGNVIYEDNRVWNHKGTDCFENSKDYQVCR